MFSRIRLLLLLLLAGGVVSEPGRWDQHRRRSRPSLPPSTTVSPTKRPEKLWTHGLSLNPPLHRCQISSQTTLPNGLPVNYEYVRSVKELLLEDKLLLSPVVIEGVMVSRTNTYKGLYFVSFKVVKVVRGRVSSQLHGHIRLLFQTEQGPSGRAELRGNACPPVPFNVRTGRKYLLFVKKISAGRYAAVAVPEQVKEKSRKAILKTFCPGTAGCVSVPSVKPLPSRTVRSGRSLKLKCKLLGSLHPPPAISWFKDSRKLNPSLNVHIQTKKKRSRLLINRMSASDAGTYTCQASNLVGSSLSSSLVVVRQAGVIRKASECPIPSFCLNGGSCDYYEMIGELVCKCKEGFAGQRCQFKKARVNPFGDSTACGPYGHDIQLAEICAAWNSPPVQEMTREEYMAWVEVEKQLQNFKKNNTATTTSFMDQI